jgi:hypothetical protein
MLDRLKKFLGLGSPKAVDAPVAEPVVEPVVEEVVEPVAEAPKPAKKPAKKVADTNSTVKKKPGRPKKNPEA